MELFFNFPIIVKIAVVFLLILGMVRYKFSLGTALISGSVVLGLWCEMSLSEVLVSMGRTAIQLKTILLNAIVVLILILSHAMDKLKQMQRLLTAFQGLIQNARFNLVIFPALIGLLPMPGGAIFSAPMVDVLSREHRLDAETKSLINYWFRHVWESAWPLYPGVLLAASLASVNVWFFAAVAFPLILVSISVGYLFLLNPIVWNSAKSEIQISASQVRSFWKELTPIGLVIVGAVGGSIIMNGLQARFPGLAVLPTELPLVLALLVSVGFVFISNHASPDMIRAVIINKSLLKMVYMITAIYMFKGVLVDSHAVVDVSRFLADLQIPLVPVIVLLPALVGFITGISVAFVGTSFPVLIALVQMSHSNQSLVPYLILAYISGFVGVMFSPLHVCLIFTREYFQANLHQMYRRLWKPQFMLLSCALLYFLVLTRLGL
jgi:uncharacterized protein